MVLTRCSSLMQKSFWWWQRGVGIPPSPRSFTHTSWDLCRFWPVPLRSQLDEKQRNFVMGRKQQHPPPPPPKKKKKKKEKKGEEKRSYSWANCETIASRRSDTSGSARCASRVKGGKAFSTVLPVSTVLQRLLVAVLCAGTVSIITKNTSYHLSTCQSQENGLGKILSIIIPRLKWICPA